MSGDEVEVVLVESLGPRRRHVTFKASVELVERLDALARRLGKSRSEAIREAIELYLAMNELVEQAPRAPGLGELLSGW